MTDEVTDNHGLSLHFEEDENVSDDERELRDKANLNSPKLSKAMLFTNNNTSNALNLTGDEPISNVTPNTAFRDQQNINSPREANQIPGGLMTQVARPDSNPGGLMTQVQRPDEDAGSSDTIQGQINTRMTQTNTGFCACFSSLWCCGPPAHSIPSSSIPLQVPVHENSAANSLDHHHPYVGAGNAYQGQTQNTMNDSLVKSGNNGNTREDSVSSTEYSFQTLLPPLSDLHKGLKCLVLDLDETLVHSSFKPIPDPHFVIPVEIDRIVHHVYVLKRPFVDEFLLRASKNYEIVIFTASLSKYADPLLDKLDIHNVISHRLFRESCVIHGTAYVKDLRKLGRKLKDSIIVDNSPPSYLFQPTNAIPIASWFDDMKDTQLLDMLPVLDTTLKHIPDVRCVLDANKKTYRWLCQQANKPLNLFTVKNQNP